MQKNLPRYAPPWVERVARRTQAGKEVVYPLCQDRRTLLWFANQRAVEYHPALSDGPTQDRLVVDLDPPEGAPFAVVVRAARLVERTLTAAGLAGAVKTSGAKGLHVVVPVEPLPVEDAAAATRALAARAERLDPVLATTEFVRAERGGRVFLDATRAGGATLVAAYSPRARPGLPVSVPVAWEDLERVRPGEATATTAAALLGGADPWRDLMPAPSPVPADVLEEGRAIPVARVRAMHEGKRRAAERRRAQGDEPVS
nr:hypothetical protein [Vallicoccus soli]